MVICHNSPRRPMVLWCWSLSHVWLFVTPQTAPPGSSVHGILQARILEWVAIPFSRGSSRARDWTWVSQKAGKFFTIWVTREAQQKPKQTSRRSLMKVYRERRWNQRAACGHTGCWKAYVPETLTSAASSQASTKFYMNNLELFC